MSARREVVAVFFLAPKVYSSLGTALAVLSIISSYFWYLFIPGSGEYSAPIFIEHGGRALA